VTPAAGGCASYAIGGGSWGAPEIFEQIDEALLLESYGLGFSAGERPSLHEYMEAVRELMSALIERGWVLSPPSSVSLRAANKEGPANTRNTELAFPPKVRRFV
jgi:hypothetical protein